MWYKRGIIVICLILIAVAADAKKVTWKLLEDLKGTEVDLIIGDKRCSYYQFDKKTPVSVTLQGPTRLKIRTRLGLPDGLQDEIKYKVRVTEDKRRAKEFSIATQKSNVVSFPEKRLGITESKSIYISVAPGAHTYTLQLLEPKEAVGYVRFYKQLRKLKYIPFAPQSYHSIEIVTAKEKERQYYRATKDKVVKAEVLGPTKLKVTTRLGFTPKMKGEQTYGIEVFDGREKREYAFKAKKSDVASYGDRICSVGRTFIVKVPKGRHTYEFKPVGVDEVLLRLLIPKQATKKR